MANQQSTKKEAPKSWLQYVTEQSWEPELLISGLAIYATLQMPGLFKGAYQYFEYNLQSGFGFFDAMLPLLIYGVFTTVAYILAGAFITHFVVRAFWVGFLGLMSVYKDGIQYEKLPYSDFYKEKSKENLGTSEYMAMRLDQISSLIFSMAFALVLLMLSVAVIYFVFFLLYNVLKLFLGPEIFETYETIFRYTVMAVTFAYVAAVYILNMKRFRSNPRLARWHFNLSWKINAMLMPLVYKPLQHIQLTFLSNTGTKRFIAGCTVLFVVFFSILIGVILQTLDADIFDTRRYYASQSSVHHVEAEEYGVNLSEGEPVLHAVIEKPMTASGMMEVFIPYPKRLDEVLNQFCEPESVADSLDNYKRRRMINEHNIACAQRFFSFAVDDSLEINGELMFTRHPVTGQEGFQSYVNLQDVTSGRHTFFVKRAAVSPEDSTRQEEGRLLRYETEIPFWIDK